MKFPFALLILCVLVAPSTAATYVRGPLGRLYVVNEPTQVAPSNLDSQSSDPVVYRSVLIRRPFGLFRSIRVNRAMRRASAADSGDSSRTPAVAPDAPTSAKTCSNPLCKCENCTCDPCLCGMEQRK